MSSTFLFSFYFSFRFFVSLKKFYNKLKKNSKSHINRQTYWTLPDSILSQMKSNKEKKGSLTKMNGINSIAYFLFF